MSFVTVATALMGPSSSISNSSIRNYTGPLVRTPMIDFTLIFVEAYKRYKEEERSSEFGGFGFSDLVDFVDLTQHVGYPFF